jgi:hypothetical protein
MLSSIRVLAAGSSRGNWYLNCGLDAVVRLSEDVPGFAIDGVDEVDATGEIAGPLPLSDDALTCGETISSGTLAVARELGPGFGRAGGTSTPSNRTDFPCFLATFACAACSFAWSSFMMTISGSSISGSPPVDVCKYADGVS